LCTEAVQNAKILFGLRSGSSRFPAASSGRDRRNGPGVRAERASSSGIAKPAVMVDFEAVLRPPTDVLQLI